MVYREIPYQLAFVNQRCAMDLFIRIRNDYRLFGAKGAYFTEDQYRQFNNTQIFILAKNDATADEDMDTCIMDILADPLVSRQAKIDIVHTLSLKSIRGIFQGLSSRSISELRMISKNIVRLIHTDASIMDDLVRIAGSDHYIFRHSLKVGIYGTCLSMAIFKDRIHAHKMEELCTAFFLHDIGMARIPDEIRDKTDPLTENELGVVEKHPVWGYEKLRKSGLLSDEANEIVLYHHERCDGRGYPFRKTGDDIPVHARICAVVDTFDTIIGKRFQEDTESSFEALRIMHQDMAGAFDDGIFLSFIKLLG
ncbi:HD domain-containing protein, partial [archaeon]|nr:HD domain-containing protein [archaeon]